MLKLEMECEMLVCTMFLGELSSVKSMSNVSSSPINKRKHIQFATNTRYTVNTQIHKALLLLLLLQVYSSGHRISIA